MIFITIPNMMENHFGYSISDQPMYRNEQILYRNLFSIAIPHTTGHYWVHTIINNQDFVAAATLISANIFLIVVWKITYPDNNLSD